MESVVLVEGLKKGFGQHEVLNGVDLTIERGMVHGLVGPGGGGKSVLLRIIATLMEPDEGVVRVFGNNLSEVDPGTLKDIRSRIGFQFQNLALFDFLSVKENVAFPITKGRPEALTPEIEERVKGVLKAVGLGGTEELEIKELSGGMMRRVAMARAILFEPDLLILDDPSAGLDPVTTSRIFALIRSYFERTHSTVIVATQDVDRLARIADRIHILYNGKVHFSGTLEEAWQSEDRIVTEFFPREGAGPSAGSGLEP